MKATFKMVKSSFWFHDAFVWYAFHGISYANHGHRNKEAQLVMHLYWVSEEKN